MTYSLLGRDPATGELGIAVQSRYFAAGRGVPSVEPGVGVVASQSFANPAYGPDSLRLLRTGLEPQEVLRKLVSEDPGESIRQVAILDAHGRTAIHTGAHCVAAAGHEVGADCCAQANMMARDTVWQAMVHAFENTTGALADRLLAALRAAEREGGDIRGRQAAALIVVPGRAAAAPGQERTVDLRVDDHPDPVSELGRLLAYAHAHERANDAMEKVRAGDFTGALAELDECCEEFPREPEFLFRRLAVLFPLGRLEEARATLRRACEVNPGWSELLLRFADASLLPAPRQALEPLVADLQASLPPGAGAPVDPPPPL